MKLPYFAAAMIAAALAAPAFAQDKSVATEVETEAKTEARAGAKTKAARHSHMDEKHGTRTADKPLEATPKPKKKPLHDHRREHKQQ